MVAFVASTVLTAANLNTAFNALTIRTVTLTSDTLVLADNGGAVTYSNASATTATVPPNSSVAYAVGTRIELMNLGAGVVTVTAGAGVTVAGTLTMAQNAGGVCVKTATNTWSFYQISASSFPASSTATVATAQTTTSTSFTDLTTAGPAVTLTTGTKVLIIITARMVHNDIGEECSTAYAVSGATTVAATINTQLMYGAATGAIRGPNVRASTAAILTGLTAGSNTFTAKYKVSGGTGNFVVREISVIDLGS